MVTTGNRKMRREAKQNELESWLQEPKLVFITKVKWRVEVIILIIGREGAFCHRESWAGLK